TGGSRGLGLVMAKALAEAGAAEGTLVVADAQEAGRGRHDRSWVSPPGNLYLSLVLRPESPIREVAQLSFAAALAVAEAAEVVLPPGKPQLSLKWPNDVLLGGRKLAGILLESRARSDGGVAWLVVGIGVNLASAPDVLPYPAAALAACGAPVHPQRFLPILAERLLVGYEAWRRDGFAPLREAWLGRAHAPGEPLRVRRGECWKLGRFAGLDAEGRLLLDGDAGVIAIAAADVVAGA
ncbi:MAG: biotin--[acetyl-CoA-carboxylase] ligase, partial [Stellaceae bacterium]